MTSYEIVKEYFVRDIEPAEDGSYQYGVFEYDSIKNKPLVRLSRPKLIATFKYEWRAIRFMNERRLQNDKC